MASSLSLNNIQGDVLKDGLPNLTETFLFFRIFNSQALCKRLKQVTDQEIAHTGAAVRARDDINNGKTESVHHSDVVSSVALPGIIRVVVPKGGEYVFAPSMSALRTTLSTVKVGGERDL